MDTLTINDVTYNCDIENMIISNLDGWVIEPPVTTSDVDQETETETEVENEPDITSDETTETETTETETTTTTETDPGVNPFMTSQELQTKANKVITRAECKLFYEETLDMAYMHTNRLNIDDLTVVEARVFIRGVCKWTASNLWNKYNIRVNNEDMEDTYVQSYGGLLYKSALKTLQPFINQRITAMSNINTNNDDDNDIWIV